MWPDIRRHIRLVPEADSVMTAPLLWMLMMCMKLCNLGINTAVC